MKIVTITSDGVVPAIAKVTKNKKNSNMYYNLRLGNYAIRPVGSPPNILPIGISKDIAVPTTFKDRLLLDRDDYVLLPIVKGGNHITNKAGSYLYYLDTSETAPLKEMLAIVSVPMYNFTDVTISQDGMVNEIARGYSIKMVGDITYSSPQILFELFGKGTIKWRGVNSQGIHEQVINVSSSMEITINPITTIEKVVNIT